ncbi:hypothetical protein E2F50_19850 [Rhizobium deserti]|uniref:Uncharacterized protein n=1 Tax=Rhizobium deserti TaxID=2547961 RepID=A0A4R5U9B8_9HYPH|nr:hypothetical protein [Rhizobium deserti]TDK31210.1 hypothetical protein E2F50_19850 [Rhizobium deserti]
MDRDDRYSSVHPQVWPVIAAYGIVVLGVAAYSVLESDAPQYRNASIAWATQHAQPGRTGRNVAVDAEASPVARID